MIHFSTPIQNMFIDRANTDVFICIITASVESMYAKKKNLRQSLISKWKNLVNVWM